MVKKIIRDLSILVGFIKLYYKYFALKSNKKFKFCIEILKTNTLYRQTNKIMGERSGTHLGSFGSIRILGFRGQRFQLHRLFLNFGLDSVRFGFG